MTLPSRSIFVAVFACAFLVGNAAARATGWAVDRARSTLGFTGNQGGTPFSGHFDRWQADIDFDPAHPDLGHARVNIDMASAATGEAQRDQALPQADWLDTTHFPQAQFEAVSFVAKGGNAFDASGKLTIRGVAKTVVLPFTLDVQGNVAHAVGKLDIVRTDYGVGQGAWGNGQMVALEVSVTFDLLATRQP